MKTYVNNSTRRAPITHTPAGMEIREKLWDDICRDSSKVDGKLEPHTLDGGRNA